MSKKQSNTPEQMVFEEINRWQRYLNSTMWIITSFFISLNILIIREVNKCPINNVIEKMFAGRLVFTMLSTMLCIIEWMLPTSLIILTLKVSKLVDGEKKLDLTQKALSDALNFKWCDFFNKELIKKAIRTPWGIVSTAFMASFIVWYFLYFWLELIYDLKNLVFLLLDIIFG